jgi:hypothetical protein
MWFSSCQGPFDSSKKVLARLVSSPIRSTFFQPPENNHDSAGYSVTWLEPAALIELQHSTFGQ